MRCILLEGPHNVGNELRVDVGVPDLLVEELPRRALALGRNLLRFVADVERWDLATFLVGRKLSGQHPDEGGLAGAVLAEEDEDLAVRELTGLHFQLEGSH